MFVQVQRPDGALEFLLKAQKVKPDDAETMAEIAEAYYLSQKFDEAISWARRAL
jgi:tetratricopeptide (TPR) repeat protein